MCCWICGSTDKSREHRLKASDANQLFGKIDKNNPIFTKDSYGKAFRIEAIKSNKLTFWNTICGECNNHRSQPYDTAWQSLSRFIADIHKTGAFVGNIELKKVFDEQHQSKILDVHLYFVKYFGCQVKDAKAPIDLSPFAEAFLQRKENPRFQLRFGEVPRLGGKYAENTQMVAEINAQNTVNWLRCIYFLDRFLVEMLYSPTDQYTSDGATMWKPSTVTERIKVDTLTNE